MRTERQEMLERNGKTEPATFRTGRQGKQPRQLLVALVLLLVALIVVLGKERDFWLGSDDSIESDGTNSEITPKAETAAAPAKINQAPAPAKISSAPVAPATTAKNQVAPKVSTPSAIAEPSRKEAAKSNAPAVATKRAVLPPLHVEVIAADAHRPTHQGSDVAKVEITSGAKHVAAVATPASTLPENAAGRERISSGSVPELRQAVDAAYPLLAQHTVVQGSVVLQALVGADGVIENLRVVNGSSILAAAAQQAVRQWRFKPFLQNGQPVETKAMITVNFSIRVSDNPAKTS